MPHTNLTPEENIFVDLFIENNFKIPEYCYAKAFTLYGEEVSRKLCRDNALELLSRDYINKVIDVYRLRLRNSLYHSNYDHFKEIEQVQSHIFANPNEKNGVNYNAWLKGQELKGKTLGLYVDKIISTNTNTNNNTDTQKIEIHFIDNIEDIKE